MKNYSLFELLQSLYAKIAHAVLQVRMQSYRPSIKSNNSFDITTILNKQVDELAASSTKNIQDPANFNEKIINSEFNSIKHNNNYQDSKRENISTIESEFSKYLKQKKSSSIIHPHMGDQLKQSAWEHIHKAIRYARQVDLAAAKLHVDIAGHALEEAEHYMNDEEYSKLVFDIEQCFINSKKEKEQGV